MLKFAYQLGFELALQEELQKNSAWATNLVEGISGGFGKMKAMASKALGMGEKALGMGEKATPKPGTWEAFQNKALPTESSVYKQYADKARKAGTQSTGNFRFGQTGRPK